MSNPVPKNAQTSTIQNAVWFRYLMAAFSLGPLLLFVATQLGQVLFLGELLSNFQRFVFFILLPFPFLLYWLRLKYWAIVLGLATLWSFVLVAWVYLPASRPPAGDQVVKFMSFNVLTLNPNHADVLEVIEKADPDVLMVVEYSSQWMPAMNLLKEKYPHQIESPRWHGFGIGLFSKLPIAEHEIIQLAKQNSDSPAIVARLQVGDQQLRVVGVHVVSPVNPERLQIRNDQLADVASFLSKSDEPTLLMGDFNCTVWSPHLKSLMKVARLTDSRQGFGYLPSWDANDWPFQIPIDHALVSKHLRVHSRRVGKESGGSDHFPIMCDVSITPQQ